MARTSATNYTAQPFTYATAGTDIFKKEDVQVLAQAVDQHDHTTGKGLAIPAGAIPAGTITSAMIADGTIQGADIANGAITTTQIQDGTITTADLANAAVTNAKLATDTARMSLLVNGGFEIWQRGNGPFSANSLYSADRWNLVINGTDTLSVSRNTAQADVGSTACAACTFTLGTGGGTTQFYQPMNPATEYGQLSGRTVIFSVRVRTSTPNAVRIAMYDGSAWRYSGYHTGGGTYETLATPAIVVSGTLNPSVFFAASCTTYVDNAMLVVGSVAADYAPLHPADDLARCLRYYEKLADDGDGSLYPSSIATAASQNATQTAFFKAKKAVTPTVTVIATWTTVNATGAPTVPYFGTLSARLQTTSSAAGFFGAVNLGGIANLTAEANP